MNIFEILLEITKMLGDIRLGVVTSRHGTTLFVSGELKLVMPYGAETVANYLNAVRKDEGRRWSREAGYYQVQGLIADLRGEFAPNTAQVVDNIFAEHAEKMKALRERSDKMHAENMEILRGIRADIVKISSR